LFFLFEFFKSTERKTSMTYKLRILILFQY